MKSTMDEVEREGDTNGSEDNNSEDSQGSGGETSEDDGFEDQGGEVNENNKRGANDQNGREAKSAKLDISTGGNLGQPPTMEELNTLRETQMLYHSNLFRMQMEEVLGEVSIKDKHRLQLQEWLVRFSTFLTALPKSSKQELGSTKWMEEKGLHDPAVEGTPKSKGLFIFAPPTKVEFVGSFAANTTTKLNMSVDVMVTLPQECVHKFDKSNGRWLSKRNKYSAWIAANLRDKPDLVNGQCWTTHLGFSSRPILQITPSGGLGKKWRVNIFPVPPPDSLQVSNFAPGKRNLQPKWFSGSDDDKEEETQPATPQYNWACCVDVVMSQHARIIHDSVAQHRNLTQGIKLLKIWLTQRQLDKDIGCFGGHIATLLVLHLLQTRKINTQMSAYQVFRNVMVALSNIDWSMAGPNMGPSTPAEDTAPSVFHHLYPVVFVDPSGVLNLTATLTSTDYKRVQHEAQLALSFLNSSASDSFESLFIKKVEMFQLSDQIITIKLKEEAGKQALAKIEGHQDRRMDTLGDARGVLWSEVTRVLEDGLGERKILVAPVRSSPNTWLLDEPPPKLQWSREFGLVLNPLTAWSLLTKGPMAGSPDVEKFKKFWGERSSLRRFQDGSFHEAVLWGEPKQSVGERRLIPEKICKELLLQHFGIKSSSIYFVNKQAEAILHHQLYNMEYDYATGEEATVSAIQAYDSLSRKLRSLELPLKISAVQSTSDVVRHTRVFPPVTKALNKPIPGQSVEVEDNHLKFTDMFGCCKWFEYAMEVLLFLEISGKWPDDLEAIQAIKAEFHIKMADLLMEDNITSQLYPKFLQIFWEGYVFRVRVCYLREIYLSRLVDSLDGDCKEQDTRAAIELEQQTEIIPKFSTALASMQSDHPSFSGGVRLCRRWASSQLLLPHLPPVAVELLAAHLYLAPAPYTTPHTPHVALIRFLHLLAHTDWKSTPVLVNLNEAFTVEDLAELNRRFTSQRASLPHMFLVTPYDLRTVHNTENPSDLVKRYKLASHWTQKGPSPQILYRTKQLAGAALEYLNANLMKKTLDVKTIFRPSYADYDVTINLKVKQLSRFSENIYLPMVKKYKAKPYDPEAEQVMPIVMYDAASLYLKELRESYGHLALFFYDEHGGQTVGVVWKPAALTPQELKISSLEGHQVVGVKQLKQVINVEAIISDFQTLGTGLIKSIKLKNK